MKGTTMKTLMILTCILALSPGTMPMACSVRQVESAVYTMCFIVDEPLNTPPVLE